MDEAATPQTVDRAPASRAGRPHLPRRLSTRLVWLTMISIMIAEVLVFVPSVANFRIDFLSDKLETVAVASFASGRAGTGDEEPLTPAEEAELLRALDAELIAVTAGNASRLLARAPSVQTIDRTVDLATEGPLTSIASAFRVIFAGEPRTLRVLGPIGDGSMVGEVVLSDRPLRRAMLEYARNILILSLVIASFAGLFVNLAINRHLLRPIREMTHSMIGFAANPQDPDRIVRVTGRDDEIGMAERELAAMQRTLAETLRRQRHLADLGLAVAKINHDLRNTLASAQLVSDRLSDLPDPQVQRFAPTLLRSLDRALSYTQSVLAYGRAVEEPPVRRAVRLSTLVADVFEAQSRDPDAGIELVNEVDSRLEIEVDPDQFHRALANLVRNALEALGSGGDSAIVRRVRVSADSTEGLGVTIRVEDTGPGLSPQARDSLFQAFRGSTRAGGTGLGLAIVAEIVSAHGGTIRHVEDDRPGTTFEIALPPRPGIALVR